MIASARRTDFQRIDGGVAQERVAITLSRGPRLVRGTWRLVPARASAVIEVALLDPAARLHTAINHAASRFGAFQGVETRVVSKRATS